MKKFAAVFAACALVLLAAPSFATPAAPQVKMTVKAATGVAPLSAVMNWNAVTVNTDGTSVASAVTYNIYQGTSPTSLALKVSGLTVLTYTATSLPPGTTQYFAATAVVGGEESSQTAPGSKTFPVSIPASPTGFTVQ